MCLSSSGFDEADAECVRVVLDLLWWTQTFPGVGGGGVLGDVAERRLLGVSQPRGALRRRGPR